MKVVINSCFGGFGLSPLATKRLAELMGRPCYFFTNDNGDKYDLHRVYPITLEEAQKAHFMVSAFDIPNPNEVLAYTDNWANDGYNERYQQHSLYFGHADELRTDPLLIQVVEELGEAANGRCAELKIVEIPDGIDWEIDEYDGNESISETHRSWS